MKTRVFLLILICLSVLSGLSCASQSLSPEKYKCPQTCQPPDCFCPSSKAPGGLSPKETPQFIFLTFDDAVDQKAFDQIHPVLKQKNPNDCPIKATFFVTTDYTDYWLVQQLHAEGHEIGVHTMTHTTKVDADLKTWRSEIVGARNAISELAQIPKEELIGFRAPYLHHNHESFQILDEEEFSYDSSITEGLDLRSESEKEWIWPYTLDFGSAQKCWIGVCPKRGLPGLFEIPMWALDLEDRTWRGAMDPKGSEEALFEMFKEKFLKHYEGNRAPFGIFLHAHWFDESPDNVKALHQFLAWVLSLPDVWFVTGSDIVEFMRHPRRAAEMKQWEEVQCPASVSGEEVCDGRDNNGNGAIDESLVNACAYAQDTFHTCRPCPEAWPAP